jgi:iron(III) transport system substrate-binding protein
MSAVSRRFLAVAPLLAIPVVLATACGSSGSRLSITLYNGQHVPTAEALAAAFEQATGIKVRIRDGDESILADQLEIEGAHSPADVFYSENSPALEFLARRGLLAPVARATLARIPRQYSSSTGSWVGVSARASVLVYNPRLIGRRALPVSALELAEPRYRGKVAFAPADTDFQPIVASVEATQGETAALRWLKAIKANAGNHVYADDETVVREVDRGRAALGVVNQYYWLRLRQTLGASGIHSAIATFGPGDPGYVLFVSGAAVVAASDRREAAQRFLAYLVSPEGQRVVAESGIEYPLAQPSLASRALSPFGSLRPNRVSLRRLGDGAVAVRLLRRAGLI